MNPMQPSTTGRTSVISSRGTTPYGTVVAFSDLPSTFNEVAGCQSGSP